MNNIESKMEKLEVLLNCTEYGYSIDENEDGIYAYIPAMSDLGEDITIEFDVPKDEDDVLECVVSQMRNIVDNFDVDEHVEMWVPLRGTNGVPNSIRVLVRDAEDIKEIYYEIFTQLQLKRFEIIRLQLKRFEIIRKEYENENGML